MDLLGRAQANGAIAPQLWPLEVVNGLLVAERRQRITAADRLTLTEFLAQLPIELDAETTARSWHAISTIAGRHGLSAYDASYLELAIRLNLPIATCDRRLVTAARNAGRPVLPLD
jgi:predicted nucleic acid-binding protein